jgi:hypothetical protein
VVTRFITAGFGGSDTPGHAAGRGSDLRAAVRGAILELALFGAGLRSAPGDDQLVDLTALKPELAAMIRAYLTRPESTAR